jgi:two-component system response regulator DevR
MSMQDRSKPIALLIVDDHQMVRVGLRQLLSLDPEIRVVGEAATVHEAVAAAERIEPDVILMDLRLPDGTGVDACRQIIAAHPRIRVLFLTSHSDREAIMSTVFAGASGYLVKDIRHAALIQAIKDAAAGRPVLDSKLTARMREEMAKLASGPAPKGMDLSLQEQRVLALVVQGRTNKEIGAALGLSDKTVKNYLSNAFQKLHVTRRAQAAAVFAKAGRRHETR